MKVNRVELINKIAENSGLTKRDTDIFLDSFVEVIGNELVNGNEVSLMGFGTFEVKERAQRNGVNPRTGDHIVVDARRSPHFKAGKPLKELVNSVKR